MNKRYCHLGISHAALKSKCTIVITHIMQPGIACSGCKNYEDTVKSSALILCHIVFNVDAT